MQYSNTKYNVKGYKTLNQSIIYQEKEIEFSSKDITLKKKIDEQIVDTLTYTYQFDVTTNEYKKSDIIDVTDYNGVKQRIHYSNTKPLYSYEINNNNEVTFINGKYNNTIKLYDVLNELKYALFIGELKENDGIPMMYYPTIANPNHWTKDISLSGYSSDKGYYLLTGWYKSSSMNTQKIINISNNTAGSIYSFFVPIVNYGEWTFFAYQFALRASFIYVYPETVTDELKDVRLTFQETHIIDENDNSHTLFQESILVDSNDNKISFNDVSFQYETNNNESDIINVTSSDLLRYIKRKIKTNQTNEIYYNNGKNIINNISSFKVILSDNTIKDVNQFNVGYRHYKNNKLYDTIIEKRLYEDMVLGKISEELFYNLSKEYDVEKKDIKEKLTTYYESIRLSKSKEKQIEMFVEVLKKYENIQELDAKLLNELIKQIVVYERELKEDGRTQRIEIEYNFLN